MADEDKEKAEKLAAAKKRFEQLKKEQQKKGKKGSGKKKEDKAAKDEAKAEVEAAEAAVGDEAGEDKEAPEDDKKPGEDKEENAGETTAKDEDEVSEKPSESKQSKQRSESFRQGSSGPLSPGAEVQDLYKKQAARIEELEKESKSYKEQQQEGASRLAKAEEELEKLREDSSDVAELKTKSKEAEALKDELASVQRLLSQAQQQAAKNNRRQSTTSPDLSAQLANKTSTIESLELELSNLRNQVNGLQTSLSERDASVKDLEGKVQTAETASDAYKQELEQLKTTLAAFPPKTEGEEGKNETETNSKETTDDDQPSRETLTTRITLLESDLRTATTNLTTAQDRAQSLEQKIETLTKLHREATSAQTSKDAELTDLRQQVQQLSNRRTGGEGERKGNAHHDREAATDFELDESETETGILQAKIRALEAENFDLRSGVWREKRAALQPGMNDDDNNAYQHSSPYEDVDLNTSPHRGRRQSTAPHPPAAPARLSSSFQDVLRSGISAFRGDEQHASATSGGGGGGPYAHGRQQSLDLLEDDEGDSFDPEAFRQAQEEEGRKRIERVKEVKRGLEGWKGWRVDLVGQREEVARAQGTGSGVFEI
ncbi:hypothetical protein KC345_g9471 [Hortaea werneckii]|nr:hypothetical protein KC345_g9471 [Hortaea werneckii]